MNNFIKNLSLIIIFGIILSAIPAFCDDISAYSLEKALMKYILSYEAYRKAKVSSDEKVKANIPQFTKMYREAYAQYQELLQRADIYETKERDNQTLGPADLYNEERAKARKYQILWQPYSADKERTDVRSHLREGPSAVKLAVKKNLPQKPMSKEKGHDEHEGENGNTPNVPSSSSVVTNNNSGTISGLSVNIANQNGTTNVGQGDIKDGIDAIKTDAQDLNEKKEKTKQVGKEIDE